MKHITPRLSAVLRVPREHRYNSISVRSFTLIELLVVIAIIAVLTSLLLPALPHAKFKAQTILCMANQRQTAIAWNTYASDNNGWYPSITAGWTPQHGTSWYYFTMRDNYGMPDALFTCPLFGISDYESYAGWDETDDPSDPHSDRQIPEGGFYIWTDRPVAGGPDPSVLGPSRTADSAERMQNPILAEAALTFMAYYSGFSGNFPDYALSQTLPFIFNHRENGRPVNMTEVWADGHVKLVPGDQVTRKYTHNLYWDYWY